MSFRIGILENGTLETVYGYYPRRIESLCELIKHNYFKPVNIKELISLGDIYELRKNIDETVYYNRDKGDPIEACISYKEKVDDLQSINTLASPVDYYLIWTNKWNVFDVKTSEWTTINKILKRK